MAERSDEPERDPAETSGPAAGSKEDVAIPADRRAFLRQLSTDAVWTAGKVAGASAAFRRSIVAAGESAIGAFDTSVEPGVEAAGSPAARAAGTVGSPAPATDTAVPPVRQAATGGPPVAASLPRVAPDPVATLTPEQHAFLRDGSKAALAVNDPAGPPLLAYTIYHWDGTLIRVPARQFTARTNNLDLDARVGLLVDDPASEAWVSMHGVASPVYGEQVEAEMRLILAKYHDADEVTRRWDELRSTGDQVVIRIRPTRFVWRSG